MFLSSFACSHAWFFLADFEMNTLIQRERFDWFYSFSFPLSQICVSTWWKSEIKSVTTILSSLVFFACVVQSHLIFLVSLLFCYEMHCDHFHFVWELAAWKLSNFLATCSSNSILRSFESVLEDYFWWTFLFSDILLRNGGKSNEITEIKSHIMLDRII